MRRLTARMSPAIMYKRPIAPAATPATGRCSGRRSTAVALFADLRGFSSWSESCSLDQVADLVTLQFKEVMGICSDHGDPFHKFMGDGFVLLWELKADDDLPQCLGHAIEAAFTVHLRYSTTVQRLPSPGPAGYGVGISAGEVIRIELEDPPSGTSEVDFVGYPLNCAARMQTLAPGFGTAVCSGTARMLADDPERYLRPGMPASARRLLDPDADMLRRATVTKGLKPEDREGFRYLSFVDGREWAWRTPETAQ